MDKEEVKKKQIEPVKTGEKPVRDKNGRFIAGNEANLNGRPVGSKNYLTLLEEALNKYETEKDKDLFYRFIERAFINDKVLIAAMKKFVSDKASTEITTPEPVEIVIHDAIKDES